MCRPVEQVKNQSGLGIDSWLIKGQNQLTYWSVPQPRMIWHYLLILGYSGVESVTSPHQRATEASKSAIEALKHAFSD